MGTPPALGSRAPRAPLPHRRPGPGLVSPSHVRLGLVAAPGAAPGAALAGGPGTGGRGQRGRQRSAPTSAARRCRASASAWAFPRAALRWPLSPSLWPSARAAPHSSPSAVCPPLRRTANCATAQTAPAIFSSYRCLSPRHTAFSVRVWWQSGWLRGASHRRVGSRGRGCISSKLCCSLDSRHKMIHVKRGLGSGVGGRVGGLDDHHTWSPLRQSSQAPGRDSRAQGRGSRRPRCSRVTPAWEPHSPPLRAGRRHSPGGSQKKEVKALWVSCLGAYGRGCRHRALSPTNSDG